MANLNKVMAYVVENEFTNRLKIVTLLREGETYSQDLVNDIGCSTGPTRKSGSTSWPCRATSAPSSSTGSPHEWNVPKNFMFIGSPGDRFPYQISELGGVRLII